MGWHAEYAHYSYLKKISKITVTDRTNLKPFKSKMQQSKKRIGEANAGQKQPVKKPSISNQIRHCISNSISDRPISLHRPEASPCRLKASIFTDNINRKEYRQYVIVMHKRVSTKGIESLEGMKCVHLMTNCRLHHEIIHHLSEDSERNWNYCELKWDRRTWLDKILK